MIKLRQKHVRKRRLIDFYYLLLIVCVAAWASKPEQEVQKTKQLSMRPAQIKPSCSYSFVTEPHQQPQTEPGVTYLPHLQSVCVQLTSSETLNNTHLHLPASTSSSAAPLQLQTETTFIRNTGDDLLSVSAETSCAFIN